MIQNYLTIEDVKQKHLASVDDVASSFARIYNALQIVCHTVPKVIHVKFVEQ